MPEDYKVTEEELSSLYRKYPVLEFSKASAVAWGSLLGTYKTHGDM